MRIAVNTRLLLKDKLEGIGWFSFETLKRIVVNHPEHEFFFLFDRKYHPDFIFASNVTPVVIGPRARHPFLWYLWFEWSVPRVLKKIKADLFVSPDGYMSLRTKTPSLIVIHDINFFHFPGNLPVLVRKFYNHYTPKYAREAKRIGTVSEYSKNDIAEAYQVDKNKIDVYYNGANEVYSPVPDNEKKTIRDEISGGNNYLIFVGALNPRKNLHRLLKAFDDYLDESKSQLKLVIVGEKMFWSREIEQAYQKMSQQGSVIFLGRLSPGRLRQVLGASIGLALPSTHEGFGIPLIEAMKCEVPVITSNVTALPEVAGDAALICDPYDTGSIKNCIQQLDKDEKLRNQLVAKGKEQAKKFSWEQTAQRFWKSIEQCL